MTTLEKALLNGEVSPVLVELWNRSHFPVLENYLKMSRRLPLMIGVVVVLFAVMVMLFPSIPVTSDNINTWNEWASTLFVSSGLICAFLLGKISKYVSRLIIRTSPRHFVHQCRELKYYLPGFSEWPARMSEGELVAAAEQALVILAAEVLVSEQIKGQGHEETVRARNAFRQAHRFFLNFNMINNSQHGPYYKKGATIAHDRLKDLLENLSPTQCEEQALSYEEVRAVPTA